MKSSFLVIRNVLHTPNTGSVPLGRMVQKGEGWDKTGTNNSMVKLEIYDGEGANNNDQHTSLTR
jgi:hypothetical protein